MVLSKYLEKEGMRGKGQLSPGRRGGHIMEGAHPGQGEPTGGQVSHSGKEGGEKAEDDHWPPAQVSWEERSRASSAWPAPGLGRGHPGDRATEGRTRPLCLSLLGQGPRAPARVGKTRSPPVSARVLLWKAEGPLLGTLAAQGCNLLNLTPPGWRQRRLHPDLQPLPSVWVKS